MRLPEHPLSGLLWRAIRVGHLDWLERVIPEDFYQECSLFLLSWTEEKMRADRRAFFRSITRHFYQVAVNYGFRKLKEGRWVLEAEGLVPLPDEEEDSYQKKVAVRNWRSAENSLEFQERLEFCKRVLSRNKLDWYGFYLYLSGYNLNEITFLTDWTPSLVKEHLIGIVRRIREAAGVDPNLPLPPMPKGGKVEFRQGRLVNAGNRPKPRKPRKVAGDPKALANLPLKEIMVRFGVSKATASRIRRRGWYCPDFHKVEPGSREWRRRQKSQPTLG